MRDWQRGDRGEHLPALHKLNAGAVSRGRLLGPDYERAFYNVYVTAGSLRDPDAMLAAALASVGSGCVLSHVTAASLWELPLPSGIDPLAPIHVTMQRRRARSRPGLVVHSGNIAGTVAERFGLAVTNVVRTWLDLTVVFDLWDLVAFTDAIGNRHLASRRQLEVAVAGLAGRAGARNGRRALALADFDAESWWESHVRLLLREAGMEVVTQVEVKDGAGDVIARVDLGIAELKIAIEYDGSHHMAPDRQREDVRRVQRLQRRNWLVLRYTYEDLVRSPSRIIADVRSAVEFRRRNPPM